MGGILSWIRHLIPPGLDDAIPNIQCHELAVVEPKWFRELSE